LKFFAKNFNSKTFHFDISILNLKHGNKSANRKIKKNSEIQIASGEKMFSLRAKARLYEKIRLVPDMLSRGRQSRIDSGSDQKQLVINKLKNQKSKIKIKE